MARILDEAGIPLLLVGDSLGQVILGYESTVRVSMDEMLHHTKAVVRGTQRALVVADLPFLSYATPEEALHNAGRFMRDAGAGAVKLEGGVRSAHIIETLVRAGIPVMGHIGWTPQAVYGMGGKTRVQGKDRDRARSIVADALAVQEAGAFSVVLELVPEQLAAPAHRSGCASRPSASARVPRCSGQIQVLTDVLGLGTFIPRHAKPFADLQRAHQGRRRGVRGGGARGHVPGRGPDRAHGRDRAQRRPGRQLARPGGGRPSRSRSTATSRPTAAS